MRKGLVVIAALMLFAGTANATQHFIFTCEGYGNMVKESPVVYDGPITVGTLAAGIWSMTVDDAAWPPITDPAARWAYLVDSFYVYDPDYYIWTGTFAQDLFLEKTGVGTMLGVGDLTFQIIDFDGDGILDPEECMDGFSGAVIIIHEGTGLYADLCGQGSYSGSYYRSATLPVEDPNYMLDRVDFDMDLDLEECGMGTDATTWGAVKALFR